MSTQTHHALIMSAKLGAFTSLGKVAPSGALQARKLSSGVVNLYWRSTLKGQTVRHLVGRYDPKLPPKQITPSAGAYSVAGGFAAASALAVKHEESLSQGGLRAVKKAIEESAKAAEEERALRASATLERLLNDYVDWLKLMGRSSYRDVATIIKNHIVKPWPKLCGMPAADVTDEMIADVLRAILEKGHCRTSNKARAYLAAAYQMALKARTDPTVPIAFKRFAVRANPCSAIPANSHLNRAAKDPLSIDELRAYWQAIQTVPGTRGALLRLHVLSGGQRISQLLRLKREDIRTDCFVLWDIKGRPGQPPREQELPLLTWIHEALTTATCKGGEGDYVFSSDHGRSHIQTTTFFDWAVAAATTAGIKGFQVKRIRSAIETALAAHDVSLEVRGRLQSHGISGVQQRHYDKHNYLAQKGRVLKLFFEVVLLAGPEDSNKKTGGSNE